METKVNSMQGLKSKIEAFFGQEVIAIAGVSRNRRKFGYLVYSELKEAGYNVLAINPNLDRIDGVHCFSCLSEIEKEVGSLLICTEAAASVYQEAINKGVRNVWFQNGIDAMEITGESQSNINIIFGECILMYACPQRLPHNIHRFIWRVCGKLAN